MYAPVQRYDVVNDIYISQAALAPNMSVLIQGNYEYFLLRVVGDNIRVMSANLDTTLASLNLNGNIWTSSGLLWNGQLFVLQTRMGSILGTIGDDPGEEGSVLLRTEPQTPEVNDTQFLAISRDNRLAGIRHPNIAAVYDFNTKDWQTLDLGHTRGVYLRFAFTVDEQLAVFETNTGRLRLYSVNGQSFYLISDRNTRAVTIPMFIIDDQENMVFPDPQHDIQIMGAHEIMDQVLATPPVLALVADQRDNIIALHEELVDGEQHLVIQVYHNNYTLRFRRGAKVIRTAATEALYRPGGPGYQRSMEHFYSLAGR